MNKFFKHSRGQMMVLFAGIIAALLGATALCSDVAVMYVNSIAVQKAVDTAAIIGANYMSAISFVGTAAPGCTTANGYSDDAKKAACTYAYSNGIDPSVTGTTLSVTEPTSSTIQVTAQRTGLPYYFGKVIGLDTYTVAATATATAAGPVSTVNTGMFPVGLQCTSPCSLSNMDPGQSVSFGSKFVGGLAPGNWQWLAVGGTGSSSLGAAINQGITSSYTIGNTITSSPGNKGNAGPVKSGFSSRMSRCASTASDPCSGTNPRDLIPAGDPCLVIVPAVDYHGCAGSCTMTIEGFALIYIEPSTSTSTHIDGCFIQSVSSSTLTSSTAPDLGASMPPQLIL
jgi:Putative Tad-like Flp pilus-assembly